MIISKIDVTLHSLLPTQIFKCHSTPILVHAAFQMSLYTHSCPCSFSNVTLHPSYPCSFSVFVWTKFFLQTFLDLNNSISWQWLLFDLIKARGKYKQVINWLLLHKSNSWLLFHKNILNDALADCIWSCTFRR